MKRILLLSCLVLSFISISLTSADSRDDGFTLPLRIHAQHSGPSDRMYFHSASGDVEKLLVFRKQLIALGARHVNCFVPFTVVCELPAGVDYHPLIAGTDIVPLEEPDITMTGTTSFINGPQWVKQCYQAVDRYRNEKNLEALQAMRHDNFVMPGGEAGSRPRTPIAVTTSSLVARSMLQNSEFLVGDILANVIYPESEGNHQNWNAAALSGASSAVIFGTLYFQESFTYARIDFVFKNISPALTTVEPIEYSRFDDAAWVTNVMNHQGYQGTVAEYKDMVHEFNEEWRQHYGTDWVFTCFVINSLDDVDHLFLNARAKVGVGYVGGPFFAAPYPAKYDLPWGQSAFTQAFIMETCKMFWALNEDPGTEAYCTDFSGYLNYKNWNKTKRYGLMNAKEGCSATFIPELCTMNSGDMYDIFWNGSPCKYTMGMIGLRDVNENNVPDAVDSPPIVEFTPAGLETLFSDNVELRFQAISTGVTNQNPAQTPASRITYALPVKDVNYFVNGAGPLVLLPEDGVSDETTEDFVAEINDLIPGITTVDVIARNILGASSNLYRKRLYYMGLSFQHFNFVFSNEGIHILWDLMGETFKANFCLHRKELYPAPCDSVIIDSISYVPSGDYFTRFSCFDPDVQPGKRYTYYVEGNFSTTYRGTPITISQKSNEFEVIASLKIPAGNMMSPPSPNPFRDEMWISIDVPASYRDAGSSGSGPVGGGDNMSNAPTVQEPIPTWVKVTIYDAAGRKVKDLYRDRIYATVRTVKWDGTNNKTERVPSGVYFLRAEAGPYTQTQKVMILR